MVQLPGDRDGSLAGVSGQNAGLVSRIDQPCLRPVEIKLRTHTHDALLVFAADKLHNAPATLTDLQFTGPDVWKRFNATPEDFIWYHQEMGRALTLRLPDSRSVKLLMATTADIERIHAASAAAEGQPVG